jgi:hypothetical protein
MEKSAFQVDLHLAIFDPACPFLAFLRQRVPQDEVFLKDSEVYPTQHAQRRRCACQLRKTQARTKRSSSHVASLSVASSTLQRVSGAQSMKYNEYQKVIQAQANARTTGRFVTTQLGKRKVKRQGALQAAETADMPCPLH